MVDLSYEEGFNELKIPTKARPIQINSKMLEHYKEEIKSLTKRKLIRPSRSPWSYAAFYVQKRAELKRRVPRLVINYKLLNTILKWIRYPIPIKKDLRLRIVDSKVFSRIVQISKKDGYKTAFTFPFGQYE